MVDRLRALLDHPLDPSAARAILVLASAILVGVAGLFVLAASESDGPVSGGEQPSVDGSQPAPAIPVEAGAAPAVHPSVSQDPQDVPGTAAARRESRALRSHRALQHVPYRGDKLEIILVGARGSQAVLRVTAGTIRDARRGWDRFLRRYRDAGRAYAPIFKAATPSNAARGGA